MIDPVPSPNRGQIADTSSSQLPMSIESTSSVDPTLASTVQWNAQNARAEIGRYRLDSVVGRGGFGEVWRGYDPDLERPVAIKVFRSDRVLAAETVDLLIREGKKLAHVSHPSIVSVFDVGYEEGCFFIVTALIEGQSLAEWLGERHRFSPEDAAALVAEMALAAHAAHLQGIVHRDIKPANILVDLQHRPYLIDFGFAITEEEQLAEPAGVVGTFAYMSPEQVRGQSNLADPRADVYSLGVVLYQLLTGRLPYVAQDFAHYKELILHREPRPPRTINDELPAALEAICLKCMCKRIDDRFTTALDLADALSNWQHSADRRGVNGWNQRAVASGVIIAMVLGGVWLASVLFPPSRASHSSPTPPGTVQQDSGRWEDLLLKPPSPLLRCKQGTIHRDDSANTIVVDSRSLTSAWSLGEMKTTKYEIDIEFEFTGSRANELAATKIGVIFGASPIDTQTGSPHRRMQMLELIPPHNGRPAFLRRIIATMSPESQNELNVGVAPISKQAIDCDTTKAHHLSFVVGPLGLRDVLWDDTTVNQLASQPANSVVKRSLYDGEVGIFVENTEVVITRLRTRTLDEDILE